MTALGESCRFVGLDPKRMKKLDFGQTIAVIANIGVIAGIAFLALELRQNSQQLATQSYQSWVAVNAQINIASSTGETAGIIAAGNRDSTNLTEETFTTHALIQLSLFQMAQAAHYLHRQGALDSALYEAEMNRVAGFLSYPGVRQWWDAGGRSAVTPEFAEFIESRSSSLESWDWDADRGYFRIQESQ